MSSLDTQYLFIEISGVIVCLPQAVDYWIQSQSGHIKDHNHSLTQNQGHPYQ